MPHLIVIAGPTASGKTSLAVALAKELNCPILSADSRQFYKEMSIGTAKPSTEEQEGVKHYFINSHSIQNPLTAGQFEKEAIKQLTEIFETNNFAILVGGSGMFIDAVVYGIDDLPHDEKVREKFNVLFKEKGIDYLQVLLKSQDPQYFKEVDLSNHIRLIRALEVIEITGQKYSVLRKNNDVKRPFKTYYFIIDHDREKLYDRINKRVDQMMDNGLLNEVKALKAYENLQPLNTVGYKEIFDFLNDKCSLERSVELIKRNTRRYAKRQLTWFRRHQETIWLPYSSIDKMVKSILEQLHSSQKF